MKIKDRCSIVVSSCDAYEFLWDAFFKCLKISWPDCDCNIYLNTEHKNYTSSYFNVECCNVDSDSVDGNDWSTRLKNVLKQIDTEYIVFLLDDFLMDGFVDTTCLETCIEWMDDDKRISNICFMETYDNNKRDKKHPGFNIRKRFAEYKFNCQAGLWRKEHLIQYLRRGESPWDFEINGNYRSWTKYGRRIFLSVDRNRKPVFPYLLSVGPRKLGGAVLIGGKWHKTYTQYLNEKYQLNLDFSDRGFVDEEKLLRDIEDYSIVQEEPLYKKILWPLVVVYRKYKIVREIWRKREYWIC